MPHVTVEFSKGVEQTHDMQFVCNQLFEALSEQGVFSPSDIKIRANPIEFFKTGTEPQTFVHATLLLMEGRDDSTRSQLNKTIMKVLRNTLPDIGSITVQDVEMPISTYAKSLSK